MGPYLVKCIATTYDYYLKMWSPLLGAILCNRFFGGGFASKNKQKIQGRVELHTVLLVLLISFEINYEFRLLYMKWQ